MKTTENKNLEIFTPVILGNNAIDTISSAYPNPEKYQEFSKNLQQVITLHEDLSTKGYDKEKFKQFKTVITDLLKQYGCNDDKGIIEGAEAYFKYVEEVVG
jgi:hypothetical protein